MNTVKLSVVCTAVVVAGVLQFSPKSSEESVAIEGTPVTLARTRTATNEPIGFSEANPTRVVKAFGTLPMRFEANHGQVDDDVQFLSRGRGYSLLLKQREVVLGLQNGARAESEYHDSEDSDHRAELRMRLVGGNPDPEAEPVGELVTKSHYFVGRDQARWRTNVPNYGRVVYHDVYPGIDLVLYGNQGQLEFDFVVAPDVDPDVITMSWEGADDLAITDNGALLLRAGVGDVSIQAPVVYQQIGGRRQSVPSRFVFRSPDRVGFEIGEYDRSEPLVIDPVLSYSTFIGGSGSDSGADITVDAEGNVYVTGRTSSADFPTVNPLHTYQGSDAFVLKLDPTGATLIYSTYLGGRGFDAGRGIAVDDGGNAYVTGVTTSDDFPTSNAVQNTLAVNALGNGQDAFVTKLNAAGSAVVYSTYLGGSSTELAGGGGIAVDSEGNAYVTGDTYSSDFPVASAFQPSFGGGSDVFISKFGIGGGLSYSSYYGGSGFDGGRDVAVDAQGSAHVTGRWEAGLDDALVLKVNATGTSLDRAVRLTAGEGSAGTGIALDTLGNIYVTGIALFGFPTVNAVQQDPGGLGDAFVAKLSREFFFVYSTFLGGSSEENGLGNGDWHGDIAVDLEGNAYVTGSTSSDDFPTVDALQTVFGGTENPDLPVGDAFVAKLSPSGSTLTFSTYLGGTDDDQGNGIAVDPLGNIYVTGWTHSTDFPTASPLQSERRGPESAFVTQIGSPELVVNIDSDVSDDDDDDLCDADLDQPGLQCSLRAAIQTVNRHVGPRLTVTFDIPLSDPTNEHARIVVQSEGLPPIESPVIIDGTTQQGRAFVLIEGGNAGPASGLTLRTGGATIRGVAITSFREWGILIEGGGDHMIEGNFVGFDPVSDSYRLNSGGGILISGGATDIFIGGPNEASNNVAGGIVIEGAGTSGISVLENEIQVPKSWLSDPTKGQFPRVLVDHRASDSTGNGPSCSPWSKGLEERPVDSPNRAMPTPRLTSIDTGTIRGFTEPGAQVILFRALESGSERGRYFGTRVEPVGRTLADGVTGQFSASVALDAGDGVAALAIDRDGNASELSQLRAPVVFIPGVGGSWLRGENGEYLWIPFLNPSGRVVGTIVGTVVRVADRQASARFARVSMDENGNDIRPVTVAGILEFAGRGFYGIILKSLSQEATLGSVVSPPYPGVVGNGDGKGNDLWRLPNDWRRSAATLAPELVELVDAITANDRSGDVAFTCQVDILTHSNGGLIASMYVRAPEYDAHRRTHVRRLITVAAPYLGTPMPFASHVQGYMFGIGDRLDSRLQNAAQRVVFNPTWSRIIGAFRNLPGGYALMPSENYWAATNWQTESNHFRVGYAQDFQGNQLTSHEATRDFVGRHKLQRPHGLDRNVSMWNAEQNNVHRYIDDWTTYTGPPQVYRMIGDLKASTATVWDANLPSFFTGGIDCGTVAAAQQGYRDEDGDISIQRRYRNCIAMLKGRGDETVALSSATLGRDAEVGGVDFSGVDTSPWIEEHEYYRHPKCTHTGLVETSCTQEDPAQGPAGVRLLDRVRQLLEQGHRVVPSLPEFLQSKRGRRVGRERELVYVFGTQPIAVSVEDTDGNITGSLSPDSSGYLTYNIPEVQYTSTPFVASVSMPAQSEYTVQTRSARDGTEVALVRVLVDTEQTETVLFNKHRLGTNGTLRLRLTSGGTPPDRSADLDVDGDGIYEGIAEPAARLAGLSSAPALPVPRPSTLRAESFVGDVDDPVVTFSLPDVGGAAFDWTVSTTADWIQPDGMSGRTPATVSLDLDRSALSPGVYVDTLLLSLSYQEFSSEYPMPVELSLNDGLGPVPSLTELTPKRLIRGRSQQEVVVQGTGFADGSIVSVGGDWVAVTNTEFVHGNELRAWVDVAVFASAGFRDVIVINPDAQSTTLPDALEIDASHLPWVELQWQPPSGPGIAPPLDLSATVGRSQPEQSLAKSTHETRSPDAYGVYRSAVPGARFEGDVIALTDSLNLTFRDTDLAPGRYYYQVTASDVEGGESSPSNEVEVLVDVSGTPREAVQPPVSLALQPNYPNPFNRSTAIGFELPIDSHVRIAVFDVLGRIVKVLLDERRTSGRHEVHLRALDLPSGIYFYRLEAGDFVETKRMVVVR